MHVPLCPLRRSGNVGVWERPGVQKGRESAPTAPCILHLGRGCKSKRGVLCLERMFLRLRCDVRRVPCGGWGRGAGFGQKESSGRSAKFLAPSPPSPSPPVPQILQPYFVFATWWGKKKKSTCRRRVLILELEHFSCSNNFV